MNDVEIRFTGDGEDAQRAALSIEAALEAIERLAEQVSRALGDIKIGNGQVAAFVAETRVMEAALSSLERQARSAKREMAYSPTSMLAAAVTGTVFRPPGSGGGYTSLGRTLGGPGFGYGPGGGLGAIDDSPNIRYGAGMGGRISGPLESYSDRGRGGILGMLLGAGGGRGGGGDEVTAALGGFGGRGGGGGSILTGGRGGRFGFARELGELVPGGRRSTGVSFGVGIAGLGAIGADTAPGLVGMLTVIPSLVTGAVGSLGVLALSLHGVGAAIGGDAKAFNELTPAAQKFTQEIRSLIPWVDSLQKIGQKGLMPGLSAGLHSALSPGTTSMIGNLVGQFAGGTGQAAGVVGRYVGSSGFSQQFGQMGGREAGNLKLWADAGTHLVDVLIRLTNAFAPLEQWIIKGIDHASKIADAWVQARQEGEGFGGAIDGMKASIRDIGTLLGALINLVSALGTALAPVGHVLIEVLSQGLNGISDWIRQHEGDIQNVLIGGLRALADVVKVLTSLLSVLLGVLEGLLSPLSALVGSANAMKIAFEALIGLQIALAFSNMASAAGAAGSNVGLFGKALLSLKSNPEIWAIILALGAVAGLAKFAGSSDNNYPGAVPPGTTNTADITGKRKTRADEVIALRKKGWDDKTIQAYLSGDYGDPIRGFPEFGKGASGDIFMGSAFTDADALTTGQGKQKGGLMPATTEGGNSASVLLQGPHHTDGFPGSGKTAVDIVARVGQPVLAPEDGNVTRDSGSAPKSGSNNINGYSLYYQGESGTLYFMTHMSWVASPGSYKKGDKIGVIAGGTQGGPHLHIDYAAPVSMANAGSTGGGKNPFGTPPPFSGAGKASLPPALQIAMSKATTTAGLGNDIKATSAAIHYLNGIVGSLTGQDAADVWSEIATLENSLKSLRKEAAGPKKKKPHYASLGSRLSGQRAGQGVLGMIGDALGYQGGGSEPSDILSSSPLADAHSQLDSMLRSQRKQIHEFEKELREKLISPDAVSTIKNRISQIRSKVTDELGQLKDAARQQAADFKSIWQSYVQTFNDTFDKQTQDILAHPENYPAILPLSAALADLTDQHTQDELQRRLKDAQEQLGKALAGTDSPSDALQRARETLGKDALAHAIDVAQSFVLGGVPMDMTDKIIKDMQAALAESVSNSQDADAVKQARQSVADAEYDIKVNGLEKQASAEQTAYRDSRDELKTHLDATLSLWGSYYSKQGMAASEALKALNALLIQFGFAPIKDPYNPGTGGFQTPGSDSVVTGPGGSMPYLRNPGQIAMMAAGGLITAPHYLVDMKGTVRGMVGEGALPEAVVPIGQTSFAGRVRGGDGASAQPVVIQVHTRDEALADFIHIEASHPVAVQKINRAQGRDANVRARSGRY